jgi:hypothetical protein
MLIREIHLFFFDVDVETLQLKSGQSCTQQNINSTGYDGIFAY